MIFITVTQRGYTDPELRGPFNSVEEGKKKVTDGVTRGLDGDETRYTFFEVPDSSLMRDGNGTTRELGYVLIDDECEGDEDNLRSEHFYN